MLQYYPTTIGTITMRDNEGAYTLQIRQGNCLAVVIYVRKPTEGELSHGYKKSDKVAQLCTFFGDEQHLKNMLKDKELGTIFPLRSDEKIVRIRLNTFYKEAEILAKYFVRSGHEVTCFYKEGEKSVDWKW